MEQVRLVKEMRDRDIKSGDKYYSRYPRPRYMVWENVCFDADTLVACDTGYKRIADVSIGTKVRTLSGRYMPVVKTYRTMRQEVMRLSVSGGEDLYVTPNHPFYARLKTYPKGGPRQVSEPGWVPAGELTRKHLVAYKTDVPTLPEGFITEAEAYALGRWIADGSVNLKPATPRIFISCGIKKAETTAEELEKLPYKVYRNRVHKTAVNFCFSSSEFYSLIRDAGRGAPNKAVPPFVFDLPISLQAHVLRGYTAGDGSIFKNGNRTEYSAVTTSRKLAYGIARLIRNVYRVSANISKNQPKDGRIGGRVLHANHPWYKVTALLDKTSSLSYDDGEYIWQPVKNIEKVSGKRTVYNLGVYEDNTYGANDVVVHNCGAFSSNKGEDFQAVLSEIVKVVEPDAGDVPLPEKGKWPKAGILYDEMGGWSIAWRVHDAQFWGVPQRRKRIALVADFGGLSAPEILLVRKGMRRDIAEGETPREGTAPGTGESTPGTGGGDGLKSISFQERAGKPGGGKGILIQDERTGALSTLNNQSVFSSGTGNCLNPWDVQSKRCFGTEGACGTLNSGTTEGKNIVPSVCLNPWDVQSKHIQPEDGIAEALYSAECRYGGGESYVMQNVRENPNVICMATQQGGAEIRTDDGAPTLTAAAGMSGNNQPVVLAETTGDEPSAFSIGGYNSEGMKSGNPHAGIYKSDTSRTLDLNGGNPACNQGGIAVVQATSYGFEPGAAQRLNPEGRFSKEISPTLRADMGDNQASVVCLNDQGGSVMDVSTDKTATLRAQDHGHAPCVITMNPRPQSMCVSEDMAATLGAADYKEPQMVLDARAMAVTENQVCEVRLSDVTNALCTQGGKPGQGYQCAYVPQKEPLTYDVRFTSDGTKNARGHCYKTDTVRCLSTSGDDPDSNHGGVAIVEKEVYENHSQDTRYTGPLSVAPSVSATYGMGGNNQPFVIEKDQENRTVTCQDVTDPLMASGYQKNGTQEAANGMYVMQGFGDYSESDKASACKARDYKDATDLVVEKTFPIEGNGQRPSHKGDGWCESDTMYTLNATEQHAVAVSAEEKTYQQTTGSLMSKGNYCGQDAESGMLVTAAGDAHCFQNTGQGWWNESNVGATLRTPCGGDSTKANLVTAVDCLNGRENPDVNGTLMADETGQSLNSNKVVRTAQMVRRLTPLECERLQGFPDGWTDIGDWVDDKGKTRQTTDAARYKALGNSIALPFWQFLARRMVAQYEGKVTMASLFDGISGFCLVFMRSGAVPIWTSEIEPFPIAVCKRHFGDEDAGLEGDVRNHL